MERTEALASLKAGIKTLCTSEKFTEYLKFQNSFYNYSWRNQMMIYMQKKNASHVAGFNAWKKLGRFVKKGEKGIGIFAPMMFAKKDEAGTKTMAIGGFKIVYVFDVTQTDGTALPEEVKPKLLEGSDGLDIIGALKDFAEHGGLAVNMDAPKTEMGDANGYYSSGYKKIEVKTGLSNLQKAKTLAHECAHWILHTKPEEAALKTEIKETEAEAAAFLALARFNVKTDDYSFAYIGLWSEGDEKILEQSLTRIQKAADEIIFAIASRLFPEETVNAADME